jgi:hypothetical protein
VSLDQETLLRLARESGRALGELGVRPEDSSWIEEHARTIASLGTPEKRRWRSRLGGWIRRLMIRRQRRF